MDTKNLILDENKIQKQVPKNLAIGIILKLSNVPPLYNFFIKKYRTGLSDV